MINRLTSFLPRLSPRNPLCLVGDYEGACMDASDCEEESGRAVGTCGKSNGICCIVDKTCGSTTSSSSAYFRNPTFPNSQSDGRMCSLTIAIGQGVCGVRLNMDVFEMANYVDNGCTTDSLTVLGSTEGLTTPVCGNMTGWATSFSVNGKSSVTLAAIAQGVPPYRYSIRVTQLACKSVLPFQSPSYAGILNDDAVVYSTEKPTSSTTAAPTDTPQPEKEEEEGETTTATSEDEPSILETGTIAPSERNVPEVETRSTSEEDYGVYLETVDVMPKSSIFWRVFEELWEEKEDDSPFTGGGNSNLRIIGGETANVHEYPWQVALVNKGKFFCGGSLISDRFVLTAAHCIFGSFSKGFQEFRISLGDHDLATKTETESTAAKVKSVVWNLHYSPHNTWNDIALIELEEPVEFSYAVSAVRLPDGTEDLFEGQNATITGWGRCDPKNKRTSTILKEFTGALAGIKDCVDKWDTYKGISARNPQNICLDVTVGTPCHGDSGGPMVVCSDKECTQVGLVSFGFPLCVNVGLPAVFTRVSYYKTWIDLNTHAVTYVNNDL